ncbi:MAG: hypothetical protein IJS00_05355 [Paludibacteraceae bacterium]|nr:hypothetical protein [Paludibacteraceae bacterium]
MSHSSFALPALPRMVIPFLHRIVLPSPYMASRISTLLLMAVWLLCTVAAFAQEEDEYASEENYGKQERQIVTGWSGGISLHGGYGFASSPDEMFRNGSIKDEISTVGDLPTKGVLLGLGTEVRMHLIDHVHLGAEGYISAMPLMRSGSQVRMGWGGALCDFYGTIGRVSPLIGMGIGGGVTSRLFVPNTATVTDTVGLAYNASYTKTPFFYLDPYVGLEIKLTTMMALQLKVDYLLPFGKGKKGVSNTVSWSNFLSPTGPRLHVALLFGNN